MLAELNRSGFRAFYEEPVDIRRQCMMSYDFHIAHGNRQLLVNHMITPLVMTTEGRVWLALRTVSLSPHKEAGHIEFRQFATGEKHRVLHLPAVRGYTVHAHVEPFLTRRQQYRRQRPEQNLSVHRHCFFLMVIWDYSHQKECKSNEKTPAFRHF